MNAERWERMKDLFAQALERPTEERLRFIEEACGDDDDLRR